MDSAPSTVSRSAVGGHADFNHRGAGFVGSNLALMLARTSGSTVTCFDNLHRRGSELALPRLRAEGVSFIHGDIRNPEDFESLSPADLLIECSAERSVHAGYDGGDRLVLEAVGEHDPGRGPGMA